MKLNHVNLTVTDAMETREFLEKYLGLRGMWKAGTASSKSCSTMTTWC